MIAKNFLVAVFLLISTALPAFAAIPRTEIVQTLDSEFAKLQTETEWREFTKSHAQYFHDDFEKRPLSMEVIADTLAVAGDTFTLGTSFRQAFLKSSGDRVKAILSRPDIFQDLYGLDGETAPASNLQPGMPLPEVFEARILKKIPVLIPNQDYTLKYTAKTNGSTWFQRVTLVEDRSDFALRETLVVVEPTKDGTLFREVAKLYPLSWAIRAVGPQVRAITKTEMSKVSVAFKCTAESTEPISRDLARSCWNSAK